MRYRLLGRSGMRVSELCLGTMTFGDVWGWGAPEEESRKIFEAYVEAGGNFVDTANNYTDGISEEYVGRFVGADRERFVIASKYTLTERKDDPNAGGNHRKNLVQTVERSLRRLGMEYLDLLWLHMWDGTTPIEEVLRGLDDLVRAGKVLHVGASDTPAWVIARGNAIAELRGWSPFVALQVPYSLAMRHPERELFPMARAHGMAVTPFGALAGGVLTGKYGRDDGTPRRYQKASEERLRLAEQVEAIARDVGRSPAQVSIAWVRQQQSRALVIPIVGARTRAQMEENLGALDLTLDDAQLARLDEVSTIDLGFPQTFLTNPEVIRLIYGETRDRLDHPSDRAVSIARGH